MTPRPAPYMVRLGITLPRYMIVWFDRPQGAGWSGWSRIVWLRRRAVRFMAEVSK